MVYIENEGALFRGVSRSLPAEVYSFRTKEWSAYTGRMPKPIEWGNEISDEEAEAMIAEEAD